MREVLFDHRYTVSEVSAIIGKPKKDVENWISRVLLRCLPARAKGVDRTFTLAGVYEAALLLALSRTGLALATAKIAVEGQVDIYRIVAAQERVQSGLGSTLDGLPFAESYPKYSAALQTALASIDDEPGAILIDYWRNRDPNRPSLWVIALDINGRPHVEVSDGFEGIGEAINAAKRSAWQGVIMPKFCAGASPAPEIPEPTVAQLAEIAGTTILDVTSVLVRVDTAALETLQ